MSEKVLFEGNSSVTQSIESVVELLNYMGKPSKPLPEAVELPDMVLVLSGKQDAYYSVTVDSCSCPSHTYRGSPCKHQKRYFPKNSIRRQSLEESIDQTNKNLSRMPKRYQAMVAATREAADDDPESIAPKGKWAGGNNGPVDLDANKMGA